jgi:hypothetical protein
LTIHSVFILNKGGVCLYSDNFSDEFDFNVNLITPFFSAIITFSESLVKRDLEELEMSGLRFIFEIKEEFVFVLLADVTDSILFTSSRLLRIIDVFSHFYEQSRDVFKDSRQIENPVLDRLVNSIIRGEDDLSQASNFYLKVIDYFNNLSFKDEILGGALLSTDGNLIYTSLPGEILLGSIKELEIRFMTGTLHLPELYYSLENEQKIFSKIIEHKSGKGYYMVLLFGAQIPLGLAHMTFSKISKQIGQLISIHV